MIQNLGQLKNAHARFMREAERAVNDVAEAAANIGAQVAKSGLQSHVRTGRMLRSVRGSVAKLGKGRIVKLTNNVKYAPFFEFGTVPHPIVARRAAFLRFRGRDGDIVFRKRVFHPGNKAFLVFAAAHERSSLFAGNALRLRMETVARTF